MNLECEACVIFDYKISRQMIELQMDGEIQKDHRDRLEFLAGKVMEHYPPIDAEICRECGIIFQEEPLEIPKEANLFP